MHGVPIRAIFTFIFASVLFAIPCSGASDSRSASAASRVLVAYNADWPEDLDGDGVNDSLQVARYYMDKRNVPARNLVGLPCSLGRGDRYSGPKAYAQFQAEIVQRVKEKLAELGPSNIDIILLTYGVPLGVKDVTDRTYIAVDNALMALNYWDPARNNLGPRANPYFEPSPSFPPDRGHFDHQTYKVLGTEMYLVGRLDGPRGVTGALELIDQALYGERYIATAPGYYHGYGYVDSRWGQVGATGGATGVLYNDRYLAGRRSVQTGSYATYQDADENIAYTEHFITHAGFPLKWETSRIDEVIGTPGTHYSDGSPAMTAPRALFYAGWYSMKVAPFEWLPGSVASHLHSFSMDGVRNKPTKLAEALSRGLTAGSGTLWEPQLTGHPRPNVLLYYILQGYNFAEASALATPTVGWMSVSIGDPLYTPLARGKAAVKDDLPPAISPGYPTVTRDPNAGPDAYRVTLLLDDHAAPDLAIATIEYGTSSTYTLSATSDPGYWRRPSVTLKNLAPATTYHYRITLADPVGNVSTTGDLTFTTR